MTNFNEMDLRELKKMYDEKNCNHKWMKINWKYKTWFVKIEGTYYRCGNCGKSVGMLLNLNGCAEENESIFDGDTVKRK